MTIRLTTTAESIDHVNALIYGESGIGKTWLCKTAPKPIIISAEKGLLTLKDVNIPVIEIKSFQDLVDAYNFVTTDKRASKFQTICLDSISDIAETILAEEKQNCGSDPRQAYGAYQDKLLPVMKRFIHIDDKNVYFTAKIKRIEDDFSGITTFGPSMPGKQLGPNMPYLFDFCLALRMGQDDDGKKFRYLQTDSDIQYTAKSRGGKLDFSETPDLSHIFRKALGLEIEKKKIESDSDKKTKKVENIDPSNDKLEEQEKEIETEGNFEDEVDKKFKEKNGGENSSIYLTAVEDFMQTGGN